MYSIQTEAYNIHNNELSKISVTKDLRFLFVVHLDSNVAGECPAVKQEMRVRSSLRGGTNVCTLHALCGTW